MACKTLLFCSDGRSSGPTKFCRQRLIQPKSSARLIVFSLLHDTLVPNITPALSEAGYPYVGKYTPFTND